MRRWRNSAQFSGAILCLSYFPPRPRRYTRLYTKDQLQLVPQERPWGFTEQAEVVNGRLAMAAITLSIALTSDPSLKALVAAYRAARNVVGDAASAVGEPGARVNGGAEGLHGQQGGADDSDTADDRNPIGRVDRSVHTFTILADNLGNEVERK